MSLRILVADDQSELRSAYRMVIDAQPDMTVIGEAGDGRTAVSMARRMRPDVLVADIRMPSMDGLEVTRLLAGPSADPPIRVLVVTTFDMDEYVYTALRNGACGFLLKRSGPSLLIEALRAAVAGDMLVSPQLTVRLLRHLTFEPDFSESPRLSPREWLIADLVAHGLTNAEVAGELHLAVGTVKNAVSAAISKLGVRNRVGLALWVWGQRSQS